MDDAGRLIGAFVVGALLLNAMPHLVAGVSGCRFESPFGRPSSAEVNVLWAAASAVAAGGLLTAVLLARWFSQDGHGDG